MALPLSFTQALAGDRARYNAKFAEARQTRPRLDPAIFKDVLRQAVAPVVAAVEQVAPGHAPAVVEPLYDLALDLLGQEILGPLSRYPHVSAGWQTLLPQLARWVAVAPRPMAGAVTNALYQLSQTPGARPAQWGALLLQSAAHAPSPEDLLAAGQVAAWRAGMAHYRASALALAARLEPRLARSALGLPPTPTPITDVAARLQSDPWVLPEQALETHQRPRSFKIITRVGAFRGFGGLFLTPPVVTAQGDQLYIRESGQTWALFADACGATFHRVPPLTKGESSAKLSIKLQAQGQITWGQHRGAFPQIVNVSSYAATPNTLAITSAWSHAVFLLALAA
jgi:hypothetical protein